MFDRRWIKESEGGTMHAVRDTTCARSRGGLWPSSRARQLGYRHLLRTEKLIF